MFTFKKKSIKLLMGVALVGLTLAVLCANVFADSYSVPENATQFYLSVTDHYRSNSQNGTLISTGTQSILDPNSHMYVGALCRFYNDNAHNSTGTFQSNYTYYLSFVFQESNTSYLTEIDDPQLYITDTPLNRQYNIRDFPQYTFFLTVGHPTTLQVIFRTSDEINNCRFCIPQIYVENTSNSQITANYYFLTGASYYDLDGQIYQGLVKQNLEDINDKLDNTNEELSDVNDNLVSIDTSIDSLNDNNTQLLNGVQRKIDSQSAQQHQDAEDIKDELEDLPQRQYEYEHDREQTELNQLLDSFDENSELAPLYDYLDPDNINEAMGNIWTSLSHNNKVYDIIFPSSGNVPLIDATLWDSQVIHLSDFTETVPGRLLIAACNGVFALSFIVGIIVFINRAISDTFKT